MVSFLFFIILTYLNLLLGLIFKASIPFSADVPSFLMALGLSAHRVSAVPVVFIVASFVCVTIYLALFLLGRKRTWPILTALILISMDTLIVILSIVASIGRSPHNWALIQGSIDFVFHAWVLWSMIRLYIKRKKINGSISSY
jgi:hypothetical protein